MLTKQFLESHAQSKLIHADCARVSRRGRLLPREGLDLVNLEFCQTSAHFASIFAKFNQLFIRHVVHVRRVRIINICLLSGLFDCPLQQSLLFNSLLLIRYLQRSLDHLFLLSPGLSFLHMHCHLNLSDGFDVITSTVASRLQLIKFTSTVVMHSLGHSSPSV